MVVACSNLKSLNAISRLCTFRAWRLPVSEQHWKLYAKYTTNKNNDKHLKEWDTGQALVQDAWFLSTSLLRTSKNICTLQLTWPTCFTAASSSSCFLKMQTIPKRSWKIVINCLNWVVRAQGKLRSCHWGASKAYSLGWTPQTTTWLARCLVQEWSFPKAVADFFIRKRIKHNPQRQKSFP